MCILTVDRGFEYEQNLGGATNRYPYSLHEVNSPGRLAAAPPERSRCPAIHPARSDRTGRT